MVWKLHVLLLGIQRWPHPGCDKNHKCESVRIFFLVPIQIADLWSIYLSGLIELGGLSISCNYFWLMGLGGFMFCWLLEFYLLYFTSRLIEAHLVLSFYLFIFINIFSAYKKKQVGEEKYLIYQMSRTNKYPILNKKKTYPIVFSINNYFNN